MKRTIFSKVLTAVFAVMMIVLSANIVVYADYAGYGDEAEDGAYYEDAKWITYKSGIPFRAGGRNQIDGILRNDREETIALEEKIRRENYVLVNTDAAIQQLPL